MSFIGTVGVVAQQGNQSVATAPTFVSIATSAAGDYDNSFATDDVGSSFSSLTFSNATNGDQNIIIDSNSSFFGNINSLFNRYSHIFTEYIFTFECHRG